MNKLLCIPIYLIAASLVACSKKNTPLDQLNIQAVETGPVPLNAVPNLPAKDDVVVYERGKAGILIAYYKKTIPCPSQMINSVSGIAVKHDRIQLCFEPVESSAADIKPFSTCPYNLAIKYEIQGIPKSVEPKFEVIGACS